MSHRHAAKRKFKEKLKSANLRDDPFPRLSVADCLTKSYFGELLAQWPTDSLFTSFPETGRVPIGKYAERTVLVLNDAGLAKLPPHQSAFWREFSSWLRSENILHLFLAHFKPHLDKSTEDGEISSLTIDVMLINDLEGYGISPHTDSPKKLFSAFIYIDSGQDLSVGTSIYKELTPLVVGAREVHHPREFFEEIDRVSFEQNSLFSFLRTDNSFHGVEPISAGSAPRRLIMYTCYIGGFPDHFGEDFR